MKLSDYVLPSRIISSDNPSALWYFAPEVLNGYGWMSDVWSLGITLIELAEGKNPFADVDWIRIKDWVCDRDPPSLSSEKWSAECVDFVAKCLVKDVMTRWNVKRLMEVSDYVCG